MQYVAANQMASPNPNDCWYNIVQAVEVVGETPITLNYTLSVFFAGKMTKSAIGCS